MKLDNADIVELRFAEKSIRNVVENRDSSELALEIAINHLKMAERLCAKARRKITNTPTAGDWS